MKHIIVRDFIMEKVKDKEENDAQLNRCLAVKICPKCGEEGLNCEAFNDGGCKYNCIKCDFSLSI